MSNLEYAVQVVTSDDGCDGKICVGDDGETEFWSNSIIEAQQFKIEKESVHGKWATYKIISREEESKITPVEPASKHRHPHADMIIEWAEDTSKVVEYYDDEYYDLGWKVCEHPSWDACRQYRFQPAKPERVFPTTSLTDIELTQTYSPLDVGSCKAYRAIADAAIKQYILDTEKDK